jgi:hypothetical protein
MVEEALRLRILQEACSAGLMVWLTSTDLADEDRRSAVACLARMHADGSLDVLSHLGRPEGVEEWQLDDGTWCTVYREVLPLLSAEARQVVDAVEVLATGLWEPALREAFIDWCSRDLSRVKDVLALGDGADVPEIAIAAAVIAGARFDPGTFVPVALGFIDGGRRSRMPSTRAIAAMGVTDEALTRRALAALREMLRDGETPMSERVGALAATLEVAVRCCGYADAQAAEIVREAVSSGWQEIRQECGMALVRFGRQIGSDLLAVLLDGLGSLAQPDDGRRAFADGALYHLMSGGLADAALLALESLLCRWNEDEPLSAFQSTAHLIAHDRVLLARIVCRWLLTGKPVLCAAARGLVMQSGDQRLTFDFDPGNRRWAAGRTEYVARKAVGWLLPHATAPASFLVCLLAGATDEAADVLARLLIAPLLVSYPVAARACLEGSLDRLAGLARSRIESVLAEHSTYLSNIERVGYVPELQPSERQRWIERRRQSEIFLRASREAEAMSPLLGMIAKRLVLHGIATVSYVDDHGGEARRLESRMGTISHTADNLMGWVYDPCGLDYALRVFRAERPPE